jgi:hypothetical protein
MNKNDLLDAINTDAVVPIPWTYGLVGVNFELNVDRYGRAYGGMGFDFGLHPSSGGHVSMVGTTLLEDAVDKRMMDTFLSGYELYGAGSVGPIVLGMTHAITTDLFSFDRGLSYGWGLSAGVNWSTQITDEDGAFLR